MSGLKSLVQKNEFRTTKVYSKFKFTPVMEEVLLTLLVFFILSGNKIMKDVVSDLRRLLKRSPNSVGTALKMLSTLDIISYYREGHCSIWVKRHIEAISELRSEEYSPVFELIARVSKALEQHYNVKKTYMLSIADMVYHIHFHLIPKHPNLVGMGKYSFRVLEVIEGYKNTQQDDKERMAKVVSSLIS